MASKADVQTHLESRREALETTFANWGKGDLSASERTEVVEQYFEGADAGTIKRVGHGTSVLVKSRRTDSKRANVLVLGRHATADLSARRVDGPLDSHLTGPGLASRFGPTVAFCEGVLAAKALTVEEPLNMSYLSVGEEDSFTDALSHVFTGNLDAVYLTSAANWSPQHPTITTGCRGRVVAELTLNAGADIADFAVSGGLRNPLTTMTQLLGSLRDDRGRISLPGFYDRAQAPDAELRAALNADTRDGDIWASNVAVAAPGGSLTSLERATVWPGVSVLNLESSVSDGATAPGTVRATVAIYLVDGQRYAEVEGSLRAWFSSNTTSDLQPSVRIVESSRPFRVDPKDAPLAAQMRAAYRLFGRNALLVPAGAQAGAGEVAFAVGAPLAFAGIAAPSPSTETQAEHLLWADFVYGTALAAETVLQLRRI